MLIKKPYIHKKLACRLESGSIQNGCLGGVAVHATEITLSVGSSYARLDSLCKVVDTSLWAGMFKGQKKGRFPWKSPFLAFLPLSSTSQYLSVGFQRTNHF